MLFDGHKTKTKEVKQLYRPSHTKHTTRIKQFIEIDMCYAYSKRITLGSIYYRLYSIM